MSTTTLGLYSLPADANGLSITRVSTAPAWGYSGWGIIDLSLGTDIYIYGLMFQPTFVTTADTSYELLIEVGTNTPEVTIIQMPYVFRSDTAVGFYSETTVTNWLPEPVFVKAGTMLSVRFASHISGQTFIMGGIKLLYQAEKNISTPTSSLNNYQRMKVANGMSTSIGGVI